MKPETRDRLVVRATMLPLILAVGLLVCKVLALQGCAVRPAPVREPVTYFGDRGVEWDECGRVYP